jgi:hypothetical protein
MELKIGMKNKRKIFNNLHILVPIYNFDSFLTENIESIIKQKYYRWKCYLFDDGSSDKSNHICEYYVNKYPNNFIYIKKSNTNHGPAYAKYFGMKEIEKYSKPNDIVIIIDGDDYLVGNNVFNIINDTYNEKKCWVTYGSFIGKWSDMVKKPPKSENYRKEVWRYGHIRTFKSGLIKFFQEEDFKFNENWLTKGTDMPLVYNLLEWSGNNKVSVIEDKVYYYREHELNTYKKIGKKDIKDQKEYLNNLEAKDKIIDDINIIMCSWKRTHVMSEIIKSLENQTISENIVLHIVNNNKDEVENIKKIIKNSKIRINLENYNNENNVFERFYYANKLLKNKLNDYVIFIDDDQYFDANIIENLWNKRKPMTMVTWYGKIFNRNDLNYWIDTSYCLNNTKTELERFDYGGTGFCVIDSNIFTDESEVFNLPSVNIDVKKIDDLWLSFVIKEKYGWEIERSFLPPKNFKDKKTNSVSLFSFLKEEKQIFLEYLVNERNWVLNNDLIKNVTTIMEENLEIINQSKKIDYDKINSTFRNNSKGFIYKTSNNESKSHTLKTNTLMLNKINKLKGKK